MAKILYIEDDTGVRDVTERVLTVLHKHSVISRVDTSKAKAIIDLWHPDLVITDHNLGEGKETGLELAIRLKEDGIKVALLSASPGACEDAETAGIPFFYKPCYLSILLRAMEV